MTDAQREALIDRRVMRRLATDAEYRNSANAEEQSEREDEITREEEERAGCQGHPAGPFSPMGETVYCDGSCAT